MTKIAFTPKDKQKPRVVGYRSGGKGARGKKAPADKLDPSPYPYPYLTTH